MATRIDRRMPRVSETIAVDERERGLRRRLVGVSPWTEAASDAILHRAAGSDAVFVAGEPGTGRQHIARLIHEMSARREKPFMAFAARPTGGSSFETLQTIAESVIQSVCSSTHPRLLGRVLDGTLYVDLSSAGARPISQLEAGLRDVARRAARSANVRVVFGLAPSHPDRDAPKAFGPADAIVIPPLRRRPEDIEPLTRHFVQELCRAAGREPREISVELLETLLGYHWPGNVKQLKEAVGRMVEQCRPPCIDSSLFSLEPEQGASDPRLPAEGLDLRKEMKRYEIALLSQALERSQGVQTEAARLLGVKVSTLNTKLKQYRIDVRRFRAEVEAQI